LTSLTKQASFKSSSNSLTQLVGTSGFLYAKMPRQSRRKTCQKNTIKAGEEDFDIERIRRGQAISQLIDPIFDSQSGLLDLRIHHQSPRVGQSTSDPAKAAAIIRRHRPSSQSAANEVQGLDITRAASN